METLLRRFIVAMKDRNYSEIDRLTKREDLRIELIAELERCEQAAHAHGQIKTLASAIQGWLNI